VESSELWFALTLIQFHIWWFLTMADLSSRRAVRLLDYSLISGGVLAQVRPDVMFTHSGGSAPISGAWLMGLIAEALNFGMT
jgi:hypothetical protein